MERGGETIPGEECGAGVAVLNGEIYIIGGITSPLRSSRVDRYNPVTNSWTVGKEMPTPRAGLTVNELNGKIYAIGGSDENSNQLDIVEVYDPATNSWSTRSNLPLKKVNARSVTLNGRIFVALGKTLDEYNASTDQWISRSNMTDSRTNFGLEATNGKLYAIGGTNPTERLSSVEEYTPINSQTESPNNLIAVGEPSEVLLHWDAVTGSTSYNIQRSTTQGGPYTTIATGVTGTTYTDTAVANGITYYYVVTSISGNGESSPSNEASATPQAPEEPQGNTKAILTIYISGGQIKEYDLSAAQLDAFVNWYDAKDAGDGPARYKFIKTWNTGPYKSRTEYVIFDKILSFDVDEYDVDDE